MHVNSERSRLLYVNPISLPGCNVTALLVPRCYNQLDSFCYRGRELIYMNYASRCESRSAQDAVHKCSAVFSMTQSDEKLLASRTIKNTYTCSVNTLCLKILYMRKACQPQNLLHCGVLCVQEP